MNKFLSCFALAILLCTPVIGQQFDSSSPGASNPAGDNSTNAKKAPVYENMKPFSHLAFGGGIGLNGIHGDAATNVGRYANLRVAGGVFRYRINDIDSNGFKASGDLNLAAIGTEFDVYPFPTHGFRLSPGILFYNENSMSASATVQGGQSFTLNHIEYFSDPSDPVRATATVGLHSINPAFTITTGWGNPISRKADHHWSFPFEIGAAFVGSPSFKMTLAGTACDATGEICVDASTDPGIQGNLQAQIAKYKSDVDALKVYPVVSVGVSYSFKVR